MVDESRWNGVARDAFSRLLPGLLWTLLVWPACSVLSAAFALGEQPLTSVVKWPARITGVTAAAGYLLPELIVCGAFLLLASLLFWTVIDRVAGGRATRTGVWLEPPLFMLALSTGIALDYPSVLRHPVFMPLRPFPVFLALTGLIVLCVGLVAWTGFTRTRRRRGALIFGVAASMIIVLSLVFTANPVKHRGEGIRNSILLLGLDSLAQTQNLSELRRMTSGESWTWYQHPVTPGLLTNSVWPSILMNRLVHETGCFLTFQEPNWNRSPYNMLQRAEAEGYETWSFFSDQFTTYIGTTGGFMVDRSGPKGWLQPATAAFKDGSILMPVMLSRSPRIPGARSPTNQSGTFAYDLRRELDEILTAGDGAEKLFVAAHLDYLHQPSYPALHELRREEAFRVLKAPVKAVVDLSLHWQYPLVPGEPLGIYTWKLRRLQQLITHTFDAHGVLEQGRSNRIVVFSDHGPRVGIDSEEFSLQRFYKVVFATYGAARRDPSFPISLLDIDELIGLPDPSRPGPDPPVVEYTHARNLREEMVLMGTSDLEPDGTVKLNPHILTLIGERLLAYYPHEAHRGYIPVPTVPGEIEDFDGSQGVVSQ